MSESSKDAARSLELTPPKSLMNLEDAEEIWTIITKRYPKAAPLLCEMETVLDNAENLLEQLKSRWDLGTVSSSKESSDVNMDESRGTVSGRTNSCEYSISNNIDSDTPSQFETEEYNYDYLAATGSVANAERNDGISNIEDPKTVSTSCCSTYTVDDTNSVFGKKSKNMEEYSGKSHLHESEDSTQSCMTNTGSIIESSQSEAIESFGQGSSRLTSEPKNSFSSSKNSRKSFPILRDSPRKNAIESEESISDFKEAVKTLMMGEKSSHVAKTTRNSMKDTELEDKLAEILSPRVEVTASIDGWDAVVGNPPKSSRIPTLAGTLKLADDMNERMSPDKLPNERNDTPQKPTKNQLTLEANFGANSKEESNQNDQKQARGKECGDISNPPKNETPVLILDKYARACEKPVDYSKNDDRKGKIEISCSFAEYKVSSCGRIPDVVKNEAAARMLNMLATSQMEENVGCLQKFSREQILDILKLDKGVSFIPSSARRATMVKLYTHFCLEQNLPPPEYNVTPDKQYGYISTCKIRDKIGRGTGRSEGNAKEKAAEDFSKKYLQIPK